MIFLSFSSSTLQRVHYVKQANKNSMFVENSTLVTFQDILYASNPDLSGFSDNWEANDGVFF
jgi:hypothetical protein